MTHDFTGVVISQDDPAYERIRQDVLWNARTPDRRPEVIVRAASDADVAAAVALARRRGLQVAVRSGGHSWIGSPLRDGTVLVDLSGLHDVRVDPTSATATVEPAVTGADLARQLESYGLAFPIGHCASVGMGGYLLSGGLGWNGGTWGPACASVTAVDVVTADGELLHATDDDHAEVLWAARGGGPGFPGIVTRFHLALQPLPEAITTTTHVYDRAHLDDVARWATSVAAGLAPSVEMTVLLSEAGRDLPSDPSRSVVVVTATAFADTETEARSQLSPLAESPLLGRALARRDLARTPFDVLFRDFGGRWREGSRFASDNLWIEGDLTEVLHPLRAALDEAPSSSSFAFAGMSPDVTDDAPEDDLPDMAFSLSARTFAAVYAMWDDPDDDDANLAWLPSTMARFDGASTGRYIAEADLTAGASSAERSFTDDAWSRLQDLRGRIDPDGRFASFLTPDDDPRARLAGTSFQS